VAGAGIFFFYICFSLTIAPKLGVFNNKPIQGSVHELELDEITCRALLRVYKTNVFNSVIIMNQR
jgi:hypothetical protein